MLLVVVVVVASEGVGGRRDARALRAQHSGCLF